MKIKIGNEPATLPTYQCYKCRAMFVNRYCLTPNKEGELICDNCNKPTMKKTLQKKLDNLGDRLKKKGFQDSINEFTKLHLSMMQPEPVHPHDWIEKGRKYDALKKRNVELVEALEGIISQVRVHDTGEWYRGEIERADKALKNNSND